MIAVVRDVAGSPGRQSPQALWRGSLHRSVNFDMDRPLLEQSLALAEAHVAKSERIVREQRELVADLLRDGHSTELARKLLVSYEQALRMHVADRQRLRDLLASRR